MAVNNRFSYSFCPECKKWIPVEYMNYFDGIRVCNWCLNQTQDQPPHDTFVYDPYYGKFQCIMCDSYNTVEVTENDTTLGTRIRKFKCRDCGEEFILL